jgi:hypothetical protein
MKKEKIKLEKERAKENEDILESNMEITKETL